MQGLELGPGLGWISLSLPGQEEPGTGEGTASLFGHVASLPFLPSFAFCALCCLLLALPCMPAACAPPLSSQQPSSLSLFSSLSSLPEQKHGDKTTGRQATRFLSMFALAAKRR